MVFMAVEISRRAPSRGAHSVVSAESLFGRSHVITSFIPKCDEKLEFSLVKYHLELSKTREN